MRNPPAQQAPNDRHRIFMSLTNNQSFLKLHEASGIANESALASAKKLAETSDSPKDLAVKMIREGLLTSWQAKFLLTGRHRLTVGNYTLLERLDRTQFGDRFVAVHQQLDRKVELQLLKSEFNENKVALERFLEQSQKAAELDHPNLMHVYDIDKETERHFLVVEYADGQSMDSDDFVSQLKISELGMYLAQVAGAISYAHQNGVIHGDISRDNLMLSSSNQMMVRNVAMSTLVDEMESDGEDGIRIGKVELDDWVAFGKAGLECADLAIPDVEDQERRFLKTILSGYIKLRDPINEHLPQSTTKFDQWVAKNFAVPQEVNSSFDSDMELADELVDAASESAKTQSVRSKSVLAQAAKAEADGEADESETEPKRYTIPLIIGGAVAAALVLATAAGVGGYILFFGNNNDLAHTGNNPFVDKRKAAEANRVFSDLPDSKIGDPDKDPSANDATSDPNSTKNGTTKNDGSKTGPLVKNNNGKQDEKQVSIPVNPENQNGKTKNGKTGDQKVDPKTDEPKKGDAGKGDAGKGDAGKGDAGKGDAGKGDAGKGDAGKGDPKKKSDKNKADTKKPKKDVKPALPPAFGRLPANVSLPPIAENLAETTLGQVICGDRHLLGMNLLTGPGIAPRNVTYELVRGSGKDVQKWTINIKRKTKSSAIAQIWRDKDDFKFVWLEQALKDRQAGYFQNCVIRLETRGEVQFLKMRKPLTIGDLAVDRKENETKKTLEIDYLPPAAVVYEVLRPAPADLQKIKTLNFVPQNRKAESSNQPIFIFASKSDTARIFWIRIDVKVSKKLQIDSRFQVAAGLNDRRGKKFNPRSLSRLVEQSNALAFEWAGHLRRFQAYAPKDANDKKVNDKNISDTTKTLTSISQVNAEIKKNVPLAEKMYELPIRFRIFFEIDGHQVDLATFDGKPFVLK